MSHGQHQAVASLLAVAACWSASASGPAGCPTPGPPTLTADLRRLSPPAPEVRTAHPCGPTASTGPQAPLLAASSHCHHPENTLNKQGPRDRVPTTAAGQAPDRAGTQMRQVLGDALRLRMACGRQKQGRLPASL